MGGQNVLRLWDLKYNSNFEFLPLEFFWAQGKGNLEDHRELWDMKPWVGFLKIRGQANAILRPGLVAFPCPNLGHSMEVEAWPVFSSHSDSPTPKASWECCEQITPFVLLGTGGGGTECLALGVKSLGGDGSSYFWAWILGNNTIFMNTVNVDMVGWRVSYSSLIWLIWSVSFGSH